MSTLYVPPESLFESRTFKRLLSYSLAGHVLLFLVLTFRPHSSAVLISSTPVMVNMVDLPRPAAARPAAKKPEVKPPPKPPEAKPEPPKPKPAVNEVVIPKEPAPLAKPKPKPVEKPEPAPKSAEELLAELTKKVEARNPQPELPPAPEPGPPAPMAGGAGVFDPTFSPWVARVKLAVRANWSGAQLCKGVPVFNLEVGANGALRDIELAKSSGDRYCDESAERAIRKSDPLPAPPRGALALELGMTLKDTL
ncbi:MAG: energy transducer TonB [Myxococcota bacterium]